MVVSRPIYNTTLLLACFGGEKRTDNIQSKQTEFDLEFLVEKL